MKLKPGQIVEVIFLDHVQGAGAPIELIAFGRLLSIDQTSLTILSWTEADPTIAQDPTDGNNVAFAIVRSTVKSMRLLTPAIKRLR